MLAWFIENGRDLPWRNTRDPWMIMLCEIMAQQTQITRVLERLPGFLGAFPSPTAMADGSVGAVIERWSGLGYNRRAVNLHRAATQIRDMHDGVVPQGLADLQDLPGIGAYTARAIRAFAYEFEDGVVDTNIGRVLARVSGHSLTVKSVQSLATSLVPSGQGWAWNQAMMEVGALLCRPSPACRTCPLGLECAWHLAGTPEPDPALKSAKVSTTQSRFEGSDRQGRGRLLRALASAPVKSGELASAMGWPGDNERAARVVATLLEDGLACQDGERFVLPS